MILRIISLCERMSAAFKLFVCLATLIVAITASKLLSVASAEYKVREIYGIGWPIVYRLPSLDERIAERQLDVVVGKIDELDYEEIKETGVFRVQITTEKIMLAQAPYPTSFEAQWAQLPLTTDMPKPGESIILLLEADSMNYMVTAYYPNTRKNRRWIIVAIEDPAQVYRKECIKNNTSQLRRGRSVGELESMCDEYVQSKVSDL